MRYAVITDGVVTNLIELHPMNADEFDAKATNDIPVQIGDTYDGNTFYRNGVPLRSATEEMADMRAALNNLGVHADE